MSRDIVCEFEGVTAGYDRVPVLDDVTLAVRRGEFLGVIGPNGGGKTTLLRVALGLLEPQRGRVAVLGQAPRVACRRVGYVPQFSRFDREFPITVAESVLAARLSPGWLPRRLTPADRSAAALALDEMQVGNLAARPIAQLSGGELQRVLLARALACEPEILFLDEPTANVDVRMEETIFDLLRRLNQRMTVVVVSHDIGFVTEHATRVACVNRGLECHEPGALAGDVFARLYGMPVRVVDHATRAAR
ncbi:MAG: ABC transporter ATP-binding protein [Burkholderiales bacterium]